jgi:broad specificity phosphatase PhoE
MRHKACAFHYPLPLLARDMNYPKIIFMRHGETEWNLEGRAQGILNSPLTAKGRAQAETLGKILKANLGTAEGYKQFVSPLGRTLETAENIQKHFKLNPTPDDRLKEIALGDIAGLTLFEISHEFPEHLEGKVGLEWYFGAPNGETFDDVHARALSFLNDLDGPAIVVAHGQLGKVMRGIICGLDAKASVALDEPQGVVHVLENGAETRWS